MIMVDPTRATRHELRCTTARLLQPISAANVVNALIANPKLFLAKLEKVVNQHVFSRFLGAFAQKKINGVSFDFDFRLSPFVKDMYFGNYELETVEYLKRALKRGDTFVDVGANIGYVSAVAAGLVGFKGEVHSFEPVPNYFRKLKQMADHNHHYKIWANQCALGDKIGFMELNVSTRVENPNIGWNTLVPDFMAIHEPKEIIKVPIYTLDSYIKQKQIHQISVVKIDVEGFEFPVLKGLHDFFETTRRRPQVICEIAPVAYPLLGSSLSELSDYMVKQSYKAFSAIAPSKTVDITKLKKTTNVVFRPSNT